MLRHKRILVLVDGTEAAMGALAQVFALTGEKTRVRALAVVPPYDGDLRLVGVSNVEEIMRAPYIEAVTRAGALAALEGRRLEGLCDEGEIHEKVADNALAFEADLIVAGLGAGHLLETGLTAGALARIIGYSPCDVLAVPQGARLSGPILLAYDGSRFSQAAVERSVDLAKASGAALAAVKVIEVPLQLSALGAGAANKLYAKARAALNDVREVCQAAGVEAEYLVENGEPAAAIVETAARQNAGLIVMGWLGKTGLRRLLMGSVVENVLGQRKFCVLIAKN